MSDWQTHFRAIRKSHPHLSVEKCVQQAILACKKAKYCGYSSGRSFIAVIPVDRPTCVMVVRSKMSGEWMLPGGHVNKGETAADAARRELKEESGLDIGDAHCDLVISSGTSLFKTHFYLPTDRQDRAKIFAKRTLGETDGYGFAVRDVTGRFRVQDYDGTVEKSRTFRGGTVYHLKQLI